MFDFTPTGRTRQGLDETCSTAVRRLRSRLSRRSRHGALREYPGGASGTLRGVPTLSPADLALLVLAASLVGLSKTALPGAATLSVAIFAATLPAKESTGALLVLLIVGDVFAVWTYHAHAEWAVLRRLVPAVLVGVVVGTFFLAMADDADVRRVIGLLLLALVGLTLARLAVTTRTGRPAAAADGGWPRRIASGGYGVLAGFTTMVANAGGPVMSLYLLSARYSINQFLGTAAWFFFAVNLAKTPFSISLGLISPESLRLDLLLAPAVVIGALVGRRLARRLNQRLFDALVIILTGVSATYLVLA